MDGESELPQWVVRGKTVMLPKEGYTGRPDQYRPVKAKNLLPEEQKALSRGRRGCLDAHTIDAAIARGPGR